MDEAFIGTINVFAFRYAPRGWAFCNGQTLSVNDNTTLFTLIGTTYGGDGISTFALPDLRGRCMVHPGQGSGLQPIAQAQIGGAEYITLKTANIPTHTHQVNGLSIKTSVIANSGTGINDPDAGNNTFGYGSSYPNMYSEPFGNQSQVGGVQTVINGITSPAGNPAPLPFSVREPYLGMYISICLAGLFPPRPDSN